MIGYLKGKIHFKSADGAVVLIGGVGYSVFLPTSLTAKLKEGEEREFFVYTHVREDVLALYGFESLEELEFFKLLLSVSGIGPKVALAILSSASVEKLKDSISKGDPTLLSAVSGVGKKTAEKAVVELKGKLGFIGSGKEIFGGGDTEDVYAALQGLGFRRDEITESLKSLSGDIESTDEKIKELIKILGRKSK